MGFRTAPSRSSPLAQRLHSRLESTDVLRWRLRGHSAAAGEEDASGVRQGAELFGDGALHVGGRAGSQDVTRGDVAHQRHLVSCPALEILQRDVYAHVV